MFCHAYQSTCNTSGHAKANIPLAAPLCEYCSLLPLSNHSTCCYCFQRNSVVYHASLWCFHPPSALSKDPTLCFAVLFGQPPIVGVLLRLCNVCFPFHVCTESSQCFWNCSQCSLLLRITGKTAYRLLTQQSVWNSFQGGNTVRITQRFHLNQIAIIGGCSLVHHGRQVVANVWSTRNPSAWCPPHINNLCMMVYVTPQIVVLDQQPNIYMAAPAFIRLGRHGLIPIIA